jgi:monofunctional biosynthetic peptidoglycan transglycosylase
VVDWLDATSARAGRRAAEEWLPTLPTSGGGLRHLLRIAARAAATLVLAFFAVVLALIVAYRWIDPPASTLMLMQRADGMPVLQTWVPLERISPYLRHAVILSEDARFCRHWGVDWGELAEALDSTREGNPRGGSTISMQVVKNLFLWPSKSYLRKALEIPLSYAIELAWSKRRILEIYLNIAEWGPGVFGAEAAARYHFRKSAALLTLQEAALLAVSLPNPFDRHAGRPGPGTLRLASRLMLRVHASSRAAACVLARPIR